MSHVTRLMMMTTEEREEYMRTATRFLVETFSQAQFDKGGDFEGIKTRFFVRIKGVPIASKNKTFFDTYEEAEAFGEKALEHYKNLPPDPSQLPQERFIAK